MTSNIKYIGMDVHKESISVAVRNTAGKIVMECVIETKANTILQFFDGLRGQVQVTFEEGTWAAWLHDLLKPHVGKLVVCDPRRNALLLDGNQNDRVGMHASYPTFYI
jgi:transposase